jgi:hypothetical protein
VQFAAAGIKSQKLRYVNASASLPKQSFGIFWTQSMSAISQIPFDLLKEFLLGQFEKSKWQSYFGLL